MSLINSRLVIRNDALVNWQAHPNLVLLRGEMAIAFDDSGNRLLKIGDGVTPLKDLDWSSFGNSSESSADLKSLKNQIDAIDARLGYPKSESSEATGIYAEIAALAESLGLLDEDRVNELIDEKIDAFANMITDDDEVNTLMELIHYVSEHGAETTQLIQDVGALKEDVEEIKEDTAALESDVGDLKASAIKEIALNGVLCEVSNGRAEINITGTGVVSGDEIAVNEDGTLSIVKLDMSKLSTESGETLVLNGGSAFIE